jgi:hypothetical protein
MELWLGLTLATRKSLISGLVSDVSTYGAMAGFHVGDEKVVDFWVGFSCVGHTVDIPMPQTSASRRPNVH